MEYLHLLGPKTIMRSLEHHARQMAILAVATEQVKLSASSWGKTFNVRFKEQLQTDFKLFVGNNAKALREANLRLQYAYGETHGDGYAIHVKFSCADYNVADQYRNVDKEVTLRVVFSTRRYDATEFEQAVDRERTYCRTAKMLPSMQEIEESVGEFNAAIRKLDQLSKDNSWYPLSTFFRSPVYISDKIPE